MRVLSTDKVIIRKKMYGNNFGEIVPFTVSALRIKERCVKSRLISEIKLVMKCDQWESFDYW